jgi:hypothetical protein
LFNVIVDFTVEYKGMLAHPKGLARAWVKINDRQPTEQQIDVLPILHLSVVEIRLIGDRDGASTPSIRV